MSLPNLLAQSIGLMDGQHPNNIPGVVTDFLQSQGVDMNEIWSPAVDIIESSSSINIYVNIPGVKDDSIDVDFFNNKLNIKGERARPFLGNNCTVRKHEIIYGHFERSITLPISVTSRESVNIKSENGVLIIFIDKAREERNRFSVRINSNNGVHTTGEAEINFDTSSNKDEEDSE